MAISATMASEIAQHPDRCYSTFQIVLAGTTLKWSDRYVASTGSGMFKKRIVWSSFTRRFAGRTFNFSGPTFSIEIHDDDQQLGKILGGPLRGELLNAACSAHTRSDFVDNASHYNFFNGFVRDWELTGPRRYRFDISANILPLESLQNAIPFITSTDWPNAPDKVIKSGETPGQLVIGRHRSAGIAGSFGLVNAIPVDTGPNQYWYVSVGILNNSATGGNPVHVYRQAGGSGDFVEETDWAVYYENINGRSYTLVAHNTSAADLEEDVVQVDVDGIETVGDGDTGTLIETPTTALQYFLNNFIYRAWPEGASSVTTPAGLSVPGWFTASDDVDATVFSALTNGFFADHADHTAAKVIKSTDRGIDVINSWSQSFGVGCYITADWKLGAAILDPFQQDISTARLMRMEDISTDVSGRPRTDALVSHITVNWGLDDARGAVANGPIEVVDSNRSPLIKRALQLSWLTPSTVTIE